MASISRTYGGNNFTAESMGDALLLTIDHADVKEFQDEKTGAKKQKIILSFAESEKTYVVNFTNSRVLAELYGDDTDEWIGRKIVLFKGRTQFGTKMVDCLSVRAPRAKVDPAPVPVRRRNEPVTQEEADAPDDGVAANDDDIPF